MAAMLKVTQVRSQIGTKPKTRGTLRALGLRRLGDSNVLPDRPEIRGMLAKVPHLLVVGKREAEEGTVAVRRLGSDEHQKMMSLDEAVDLFAAESVPPDVRQI